MPTPSLAPETYDAQDNSGIAAVHDFLDAHEAAGRGRPEPRYLLAGSEPGDQVELPKEVYMVLRQAVDAMSRGMSVTISPLSKTLTSQQAADLLGVSRPTVIKLLNEGKIPFERIGTHRRIMLNDLLEYRQQRREEQYAFLAATSTSLAEEDTSLDEALADLKEARRAVAKRRRSQPHTD